MLKKSKIILSFFVLFCLVLFCGCNSSPLMVEIANYPEGKDSAVPLLLSTYAGNEPDVILFLNYLNSENIKCSLSIYDTAINHFADKTSDQISESYFDNLKNIVNQGHEIVLRIDYSAECDDNALLDKVTRCHNILKEKTGYDLSIVHLGSYEKYPVSALQSLEKRGFIVDTHYYWMALLTEEDAESFPGSNAENERRPHLWVIALKTLKDNMLITKKRIADIKARNVYLGPVGGLEKYRRAQVNAWVEFNQKDFKLHTQSPLWVRITGGWNRYCKEIGGDNQPIPTPKIFPSSEDTYPRYVKTATYPGNQQGNITLTIDDTSTSVLDTWGPLFKEKKIPATFFLHFSSPLLKKHADYALLQKAGMELGCHSFSHRKSWGHLPPETISDEMTRCQELAAKYDFALTSFCYPGNDYTYSAEQTISSFFPWQVNFDRHVVEPDNVNTESYVWLLLHTNNNYIDMLHMPIWKKQNFYECYKNIIEYSQTKKLPISFTTFHDNRLYEYERNSVKIHIQKSSAKELIFSLSEPGSYLSNYKNIKLIPLTIVVYLRDDEKVDQVLLNGKNTTFKINGTQLYFDAEPGAFVKVIYRP